MPPLHPGSIPLRPRLQAALQCDVLIIGGGFSGLHTALRLALAGKKVVAGSQPPGLGRLRT